MRFGHFDVEEFGADIPNSATQNIYLLCTFVLNPVREKYGETIITSGYRSEEHNRAVGGVATSQHVYGEAADFFCPKSEIGMAGVYKWIKEELLWKGELFFYMKRGHIHVGLPRFNIHADHQIFADK